jgi:hypothetical protein
MFRQQTIQQPLQIVCFLNEQSLVLHDRLQVFLGGLLRVEAKLVGEAAVTSSEFFDESVIVLGLLYPLASARFHTRPCPSSRSPCEMNRRP